MPLLHRKPFVRQKPPLDLKPDEEVFLCKVTHEIFRTYDEFFERTILCNSLVWSCAVTGKLGLTYQEAVESERRARQSLQSFPQALLVPILHLTALTHRTRLHEICDDVYSYVKERFFAGEMVDVMCRGGVRQQCRVLEVLPPHSNGAVNGYAKHHAEGDPIIISDSEEEGSSKIKSPITPVNGKKASVNPSVFKYKVLPVKAKLCEPMFVKANQINRKKNQFTRDRLKLLLKHHCEPQNGVIRLKAAAITRHKLLEQNFSHFFPDEPPVFTFSPPGKGRSRIPNGSPGVTSFPSKGGNVLRAAEEKLRLLQQKEEMMASALEKAKLKKEREDVWEARKKEKEDKEKKKEEMKKIVEEEKQRRKEEKERMRVEKEKEREKLREAKKKYAERLKLWSKRREDMECDDLKELPSPVPVKTRLPPELFGDALMVLEFLQAFGEIFDLKDEFPDGMTLEVLEEALVGCDPEGPLCELLFFFLSAIFQAQAEEQEEVARDQLAEADTKDLSEALDEDADSTQSDIGAVASLAAAWPQLYQGCSLKQLDLDSCTLSEILRLHILASGADCSSANAKFRYQKQGGFGSTDDACVEMRLANPGLLKRLSCTAVYDLLPGEKLKILHALCGKLLTLVSTRDFIEDSADELRQTRQELRELKAEQHRREREEAADRVRKRKEEKLKEQEQKLKERHEKLKEEEDRNGSHLAEDGPEDMDTSTESQSGRRDHNMEEDEEQVEAGKAKKAVKANGHEKEALTLRERDLQERIQKAAACTYILPLGRDRLYRRYWLFPSSPALFVEEDFSGLTEDMLLPRPAPEPKEEAPEEYADAEADAAAPYPVPGPPVNRPNAWAFYSSSQEVEQLLEALNSRGHREGTLREALLQERDRINHMLSGCLVDRFHHPAKAENDGKGGLVKSRGSTAAPDPPMSAERHMENRLRDLLLDMEDRIYQGTLGALKVMERGAWRLALENGHYELLRPDLRENGDHVAMEIDSHVRVTGKDRLQEPRGETQSAASTGSSTPQPVVNSIHYLARALAQIEQGIERKFLKAPLGDDDSKKDQKVKKKEKKKDDDQSSERDDGSESGRPGKTVQERWRESLLGCSSLSQVFLHLSTLERSVVWAKSILNTRCKVCHKKGDAETMLLCDGCGRGHHIHCVRPKLKAIPAEEWFCPDCRPKKRSHRLTSRQRSSVDSEEEMEAEEEGESEEEVSEEEEESGEEESEEEMGSPPKKGRAAVKLPLTNKAGRPSTKSTPRQTDSGRSTPKNSKQTQSTGKSTPKSSGKKGATAPSSRPPPRTGSRVSARLIQETVSANGGSKPASRQGSPSKAQSPQDKREARKRAHTEVSPKARVVLTPPPSSSNRRSSGRNMGVHELSAFEQLSVELVRHEDSWPFMKLVSRNQVPDYYDIIKKPIALSIIREKVNNCEYKTASDFIADVELMFTNCLEYNPRTTNEAKAGIRLQAFFHSEVQKLGLSVQEGDQTAPALKRPRV